MNKQDFKTRVGMGFFSCEWTNNAGTTSKIKRGILGLTKKVDGQPNEHNDYVLVYKLGNGYGTQRRWANLNPNTITHINGVAV